MELIIMLHNEYNRANVARDSASAFVNLQSFAGYATSVYAVKEGETTVMEYRHHRTVLATARVTENFGIDITFTDCGGYRSVTTKARVNAILREFGFYLASESGAWFVGSELHNEEIPFSSGVSLEQLRAINRTIRTEQRERREVTARAAEYADARTRVWNEVNK